MGLHDSESDSRCEMRSLSLQSQAQRLLLRLRQGLLDFLCSRKLAVCELSFACR